MGTPCMASRWKYAERNNDVYDEGKETKGKTVKKMEGQRHGIIRRNWSGLEARV